MKYAPQIGDFVTVVNAHNGWGNGLKGFIRKCEDIDGTGITGYYLNYVDFDGTLPGPNHNFRTWNDLHYYAKELRFDPFLSAVEGAKRSPTNVVDE